MPTITTKDGIEIFYKIGVPGRHIVFSHGWPPSSDDWGRAAAVFFRQGYRSSPMTGAANRLSTVPAPIADDTDHYADVLARLVAHLDPGKRHPCRPFHRWRRRCCCHSSAWRKPRWPR